MIRSFWCIIAAGIIAGSMAGCDPNAKTNADERLGIAKDRLSKEYESCAKTSDCAGELRCFDHTCSSPSASVVGDYLAAVGDQALAAGNVEQAIKAYTDAVNRYESDKIDTPLSVLCGKGVALTAARDQREQAQKAARTLHECLRRAPVGSSIRERALQELAKLGAVGLDPELLAREEAMQDYLTKKPAGPSSDKIKVVAKGEVKTRSRSYTEFVELLQSDSVHSQLLPCWESNYKATKDKALSATFDFRYRFYEGYDESEDRDKLTIKSSEPAAGSGAKCMYDIIVPLADEFSKAKKGAGRWDGNITVTLQ